MLTEKQISDFYDVLYDTNELISKHMDRYIKEGLDDEFKNKVYKICADGIRLLCDGYNPQKINEK